MKKNDKIKEKGKRDKNNCYCSLFHGAQAGIETEGDSTQKLAQGQSETTTETAAKTGTETAAENSGGNIEGLLRAFVRIRMKIITNADPDLPRTGMTLMGMMSREEEISMSEITESLGGSKSAASQQISKLEIKGLVKRKWAKGDRRRIVVTLTEKGKTAMKNAYARMFAFLEEKLKILTKEEELEFIRIVDKIMNANPDI